MNCYWDGFLERNKNNRILFKYGRLAEYNGKVENWSEEKFCELFLKDKIACTNPGKLNDPFEFKPGLDIINYEKARRKYERIVIKNGCPEEEAKSNSFELFSNPQIRKTLEEGYQKEISKCGVYCLTPEWNNHLMWAHYADGHQGYCLVFVFKKSSPETKFITRVKYSNEKPVFIYEDEDFEDSAEKSFRTKLKCWSYEKEYRLLSPHEGCMDSPTKALKGIIFGCRMKSYIKKLIFNLNCRRSRQLRLYEAFVDKEYKIGVRDYIISQR